MVGPCGLCQNITELQVSHLLPKAGYKLLRAPGKPPVLTTAESAVASDEQVAEYFLCRDCEVRFSKRGERYTIANCYRKDANEFKVHDALRSAAPVMGNNNFRIYDGAAVQAIDTEKLTYFAVSVIWRAAARRWGDLTQLDLGPYLEPLRSFLLDQQGLPAESAVLVDVSVVRNPPATMAFPFTGKRDGYRAHGFGIPGLRFQVLLGSKILPELRELCAHRKKRIIMSDVSEQRIEQEMLRMMKTTKRKGKFGKKGGSPQ